MKWPFLHSAYLTKIFLLCFLTIKLLLSHQALIYPLLFLLRCFGKLSKRKDSQMQSLSAALAILNTQYALLLIHTQYTSHLP